MNQIIQNTASWSDTLITRKAHLNALLRTINSGPGKINPIQKLTISAIKAEIAQIESQLNRRK